MPRITIIDWATSPQGDPDSTIERVIIGEAAEVNRFLCETDADLTDAVCGSDALIVWHNMPLTATGIARLKNCRAIIRNGVGFDSVDIAAASERGIAVCNVPDYGTEEVADHAIALTMALCRQLFPLDAEAKALGWNIKVGKKLRRLSTLTFGIVGLGRIGTATALRAKALGFRVLSLHCPLNDETQHLIAERELALLKPDAFVVNTARGAVIKKTAILAALYEGRIAGAGLDVIEDEPLRSVEEAATPNLIATCHAAFCSVESKIEMRSTSARIALAAVTGQPLENVVNGVE